jgi:hypothetical protein
MEIVRLAQDNLRYPPALKTHLGADAPARIAALGNLDILQRRTLALFSSIRCPGNLILQTYDLAQNLRQQGITVIGGFHSPMERETLTILLRGAQGVVLCHAREPGRVWSGRRRDRRANVMPTTKPVYLNGELFVRYGTRSPK